MSGDQRWTGFQNQPGHPLTSVVTNRDGVDPFSPLFIVISLQLLMTTLLVTKLAHRHCPDGQSAPAAESVCPPLDVYGK